MQNMQPAKAHKAQSTHLGAANEPHVLNCTAGAGRIEDNKLLIA